MSLRGAAPPVRTKQLETPIGLWRGYYIGTSDPFWSPLYDCKKCAGTGANPQTEEVCKKCKGEGKTREQKVKIFYDIPVHLNPRLSHDRIEEEGCSFSLYDGEGGGAPATLYVRMRAITNIEGAKAIEDWDERYPRPRIPLNIGIDINKMSGKVAITFVQCRDDEDPDYGTAAGGREIKSNDAPKALPAPHPTAAETEHRYQAPVAARPTNAAAETQIPNAQPAGAVRLANSGGKSELEQKRDTVHQIYRMNGVDPDAPDAETVAKLRTLCAKHARIANEFGDAYVPSLWLDFSLIQLVSFKNSLEHLAKERADAAVKATEKQTQEANGPVDGFDSQSEIPF